MKAVTEMVGLQRAALYKMKRDGAFPQPIKLGARAVGWVEEDVLAWIASRANRSSEHSGQDTLASSERAQPLPEGTSAGRGARGKPASFTSDGELMRLRAIARRVRRINRLQAEIVRLLKKQRDY